MKKYILSVLIAFTLTVGIWTLNNQPQENKKLGAFSDPFLSLQVGTSPQSGYYLQTDGTNSSWQPVVGGGGSGGGTWATTTSTVAGQLINYPLNVTDIPCIGSTATTTCEFYLDPNTKIFGITTGGIINWNNGDVILTHSANQLTLTGATLTQTGLFKINDDAAGNPEFDFQESGTTRSKTFYDITNDRFTFQNNENNNADALYFADPSTFTGNALMQGTLGVSGLVTFPYSSSTVYSSFINASTTNLNIGGDSLNNLEGTGLIVAGNALGFDCSDVEGTGIDCSGENITLDATGDWTGTLDGIEGAALVQTSRILTVAGTANQITSSAGAQDLSANRTWTLSFPNQLIFPQYASSTLGFSTPYASSTFGFFGSLTVATSSPGCAAFMSTGLLVSTGAACGSGGANPGGTGTELQYRAGASTFGATMSGYDSATTRVSFGTTTSTIGDLTIASSTEPQLSLSSGAGFVQHFFRSVANWFYMGTTTTAGLATSTVPIMTVDPNGKVGIASSTPFRKFSVMGDVQIDGGTAATSTTYIYSTSAGKGGSIVLEDVDGAGCTEVTALNGVLTAVTVTCPAE